MTKPKNNQCSAVGWGIYPKGDGTKGLRGLCNCGYRVYGDSDDEVVDAFRAHWDEVNHKSVESEEFK